MGRTVDIRRAVDSKQRAVAVLRFQWNVPSQEPKGGAQFFLAGITSTSGEDEDASEDETDSEQDSTGVDEQSMNLKASVNSMEGAKERTRSLWLP